MDVAAWLRGLGLERYVSAFRDNDIDAEVLPKLTAEDLISIGVTSVGHRRRLLDAIADRRCTAIQGLAANSRPIKSVSASMASFSSGPLVSMVIVLPTPAVSSITATILRALALRPRTASHTLQLNREASCAILADGRA